MARAAVEYRIAAPNTGFAVSSSNIHRSEDHHARCSKTVSSSLTGAPNGEGHRCELTADHGYAVGNLPTLPPDGNGKPDMEFTFSSSAVMLGLAETSGVAASSLSGPMSRLIFLSTGARKTSRSGIRQIQPNL